MSTRLYVGNISFKATEDNLRDLFSKAGEVVSVKLIKDAATGRLRGFGFVEMGSDQEAQKAIKELTNTTLNDRKIIVNEARPEVKRNNNFNRGPRQNRW